MTDSSKIEKNIGLALIAAIAAVGAVFLLLLAAFPYIYAESGSARYAREHRFEAVAEVVGAAVLLWVSWRCIGASFSARTWSIIAGVLVAAGALRELAAYRRVPANARLIGGNWYIVATRRPGEADTAYYRVYYKHRGHYQSIEDLASEVHFVPRDCLVYRGPRASGHRTYAMCGYRSPVETADSMIDESELLRQAQLRPPFRVDWRLPR